MFARLMGFVLGLLAAGVLHAAEPCTEMVRLHRAHSAHAAQADSDPATLNRLLSEALAARDACFTKYQWSREVDAAVDALSHPVYVVPAASISSSEATLAQNAYEFSLFAAIPGHDKVLWGTASMPCKPLDGKCFNEGAESPSMVIGTRVTVDGRPAVIQIRGEESKRLAATSVALGILHQQFQHVFGRPLAELSGRLAELNLANFQQEFAERRYKKSQSEDAAKVEAIKAISFGKHRMAKPFNYSRFEVELGAGSSFPSSSAVTRPPFPIECPPRSMSPRRTDAHERRARPHRRPARSPSVSPAR
ncbi:MAG: hypothetical protein R3F60_05290 [bacterium]